MKRFKQKLKGQNAKIAELESEWAMKQTAINNLEAKCDCQEQHIKFGLRIHGLDFNNK